MIYCSEPPRRTCRQPVRTPEQLEAKKENVSKGMKAWHEGNRLWKNMLPMEQYCSTYGKGLKDADVAKMLAERQQDDPNFKPLGDHWDLSDGGTSMVLASMCIKEDPKQSYADLALRLAKLKCLTFASAAYAVTILRNGGLLGYYDDFHGFHPWKPGIPVILNPYKGS